ncbi:metallophosphoesterase [Marinifilum sp.]|uniref:metallophosphoesterase n=1 Tax=Marinifilum sp. TaxID=2033137 RepID=UPI003BA99324
MRLSIVYNSFLTLFILISFSFSGSSQDKSETDSLVVSSYLEGPHIKYNSKNRIEVFYIQHDSIKNVTKKISKSLRYKNDTLTFKGFAGSDTATYIIPKYIRPQSGIYKKADKIIVFGDIHGEFNALKGLLRYNKVIDEKNKWIFGNGHIVFTGDVFDRGAKVSECLWLIFQLEIQAKKAGGRVHYIIGNHEMMVLLNDDRYVNNTYKHTARHLKWHYSNFFNKSTVLGEWLRSKNTIMKIGDQLFVHGGISPQFLEKKLKIDDVNVKMRYHLNNYTQLKDTALVDLFLYSCSPLWYRGYLSRTPNYDKISITEVIKTLAFYEATVIIFGHTPVSRVYPFYSFKLIAMDVPIGDPNFIDQALLIENQKYYRIFAHKEKERLR